MPKARSQSWLGLNSFSRFSQAAQTSSVKQECDLADSLASITPSFGFDVPSSGQTEILGAHLGNDERHADEKLRESEHDRAEFLFFFF